MTTPSRIARSVASTMWPGVQSQTKIKKGVFGFSCSGHGGVIAVIGEADLPEHLVDVAREQGFVELVCVVTYGKRTQLLSTAKYTREGLIELADTDDHASLVEVWVGEEDCGWATIAYADPDITQQGKYFADERITPEYIQRSLERWTPDFLNAATGS